MQHLPSHHEVRARRPSQDPLPLLGGPVGRCDPPQPLQEPRRIAYLYHLLHQRLVRASFGALQPADILPDPCDEGEFGPLAHGVPGSEADKGEQPDIVCGRSKENAVLT